MLGHDLADAVEFLALALPDEATNGRPRPPGDGKVFPALRRLTHPALHDLHDVAIAQSGAQRTFTPIDLRRHRGVAQLGMHRIGEIKGRCARRKRNQVALRREAIDLVGEHLELGVLEEFVRIAALVEDFHEGTQAFQRITAGGLGRVAVVGIGRVLVAPVGRHAALGHRFHLLGTNLQLDAHILRPDDRGVQRTIIVRLGQGDEVAEAFRHAAPGLVDHAEGAIAVVRRLDDQAEGIDVGDFLEGEPLALQLAPDRIGPLFAAEDPRLDPRGRKPVGDRARHDGHFLGMLFTQKLEPLGDGFMGCRVDVLEGQVLKLDTDPVDPDTAGERGVDFECLAGNPLAFVLAGNGAQRAHIVQAVAQFHDQHAHVGGDRDDELLEVFCLFGALGAQFHLAQLGDAIDQTGGFLAEFAGDVLERGRRILDGIVQQPGAHRRHIHAQVGKDHRHGGDMGKIGLARLPPLRPVRFFGKIIGPPHEVGVDLGKIPLNASDQLVRAWYGGRRRCQIG